MNRNLLFIVLFLIGFITILKSMNKSTDYSDPKNKVPVIIDTLKITRVDRSILWFTEARYEPIYIGNYRDSIFVNYVTSTFSSKVENNFDERYRNYKK